MEQILIRPATRTEMMDTVLPFAWVFLTTRKTLQALLSDTLGSIQDIHLDS